MVQEAISLELLNFIYDSGADRCSEEVGIGKLTSHWGNDAECRAWLKAARLGGLVSKGPRAYPTYSLTPEGVRVVEESRQRRNDSGARRRALRQALLSWVDSRCKRVGDANARPEQYLDDPTAQIRMDGVPFALEDVQDAVDWLVEKRLVASRGSASGHRHFIVSITQDGRDCVDSGRAITDWLDNRDRPTPQPAHTTNYHSNVDADGSVAIATGLGAVVTATSISIERALILADALEQCLPLLNLGPEADEQLKALRDLNDPGRMKRAAAWFGNKLSDGTAGALGNVLSSFLLQSFGMGG